MEKEIKNLESSNSNIGVDPYREVRREAFRNGYDAAESDYWKKFRRKAAKDAMCQLIGMGRDDGYKYSPKEVACYAIIYADELVKQLKEDKQ